MIRYGTMKTSHVCLIILSVVSMFCAPCGGAQAISPASRFVPLHPPRRVPGAQPCKPTEINVDSSWKIVPLSDEAEIIHAAADLSDYFKKSMGEKIPVERTGNSGPRTISISLHKDGAKLSSRLKVGDNSITITGFTAREAAQGCYRLEDEMNLRGIPAVEKGERTYTRMFSPRMTHSGWELDEYPDEYLDHVAHAGMDSVIVYITEAPDISRNGRIDIRDLVRRAKTRGLDVYIYAHQIADSSKFHPDDPDAAEHCDRLWGSIVRNAPDLKGIVFVGESIAFTSKDPFLQGFWWKRVPGSQIPNGFWPTLEWVPWLKHVTKAVRKYNPDFEVLFWTYNWANKPKEHRLKLLEQIPTNITLHVTFDMGDQNLRKNGLNVNIDDYSITRPGPSDVFRSEAEVAARRGIRLTAMSNTGGRTWDCGVVPYEPVPERWLDRYRALRASREKWGLAGLMESHHYGFRPSFISELAKAAFTVETQDAALELILAKIAARDFGEENAAQVMSAWHDWSEAFKWHSARWFDQSGPLRIGPTYPFTLPDENFPLPLHPQYEYYDGLRYGNGWKYLGSSYCIPEEDIAPRLEYAEREISLWASGNGKMSALMPKLPPARLPHAQRIARIGRFFEKVIRTQINAMLFRREGLVFKDSNRSVRERRDAADKLLKILNDEEANVRSTIPLVEADASLGWEPSMFYITDRENLEWKLRQLDATRGRIKSLAPAAP